ncbi:MAG: hypothetical protein SF182_27915 [Deltaproteobacteria bacterium]|nr:hypothetical protein [Deltaproteobacteria bacterium]
MSVTIALLAALAHAPAAIGEPIVIGVDQGATFDAIIDGYPMLAVFDGEPDFPTGYNTLSIGLQIPITEERGIGEFPVTPLGGAGPDAVQSATLVFNIDDVIGTFGPGTSFRGAASQTILIHLFAGNGEVTLDDHLRIERAAHTVDTKSLGRITDQTLSRSGPLTVVVDVTDDVRALLSDAAVSIGVVFRTTDSGSATSLDNLGDGGGGPPNVNGSFLPYLTVEIGALPSPTPTHTARPTETPTSEPRVTLTATPAATSTSSAPPTATPTSDATSATPTTTPDGAACAGDCNRDGSVAVNELIAGVNLALGTPTAACTQMDGNGDGAVGVNELIQAVNAALTGC